MKPRKSNRHISLLLRGAKTVGALISGSFARWLIVALWIAIPIWLLYTSAWQTIRQPVQLPDNTITDIPSFDQQSLKNSQDRFSKNQEHKIPGYSSINALTR